MNEELFGQIASLVTISIFLIGLMIALIIMMRNEQYNEIKRLRAYREIQDNTINNQALEIKNLKEKINGTKTTN